MLQEEKDYNETLQEMSPEKAQDHMFDKFYERLEGMERSIKRQKVMMIIILILNILWTVAIVAKVIYDVQKNGLSPSGAELGGQGTTGVLAALLGLTFGQTITIVLFSKIYIDALG